MDVDVIDAPDPNATPIAGPLAPSPMCRMARVVPLAEQQAREAEVRRTSAIFDYIFGDPEHLGGRPPELEDAIEQHWNDIIEMRDYAAEQESPQPAAAEARPQRVVALSKEGE
eukprot:6127714-Prorocentrum_lima.AAC.1